MKQPVRAKLLDVLIEGPILTPLPNRDVFLDPREVLRHNDAIRPFLQGAQCIEASNVARFFEESYTGPDNDARAFWKDLKSLVPPYRSFFVEWEKPPIPTALRMGMLFLACPADLADATARTILGVNANITPKKIAEFLIKKPKWIYLTFDFLEFPKGEHLTGFRGPYHVGVTSVSEEGDLLDFWISHASLDAISEKESAQVGVASLVGWTALAMLNCQNIETTEHRVPDAFQKARTRKSKRPLVSFHTIKVNLDKTPRSIAVQDLPEVDSEGRVRLHKKRGHIKDYRKGKGLFGRIQGVWYWGPSLAGSSSEGVVVSDYEVNPRREGS